MRLSLSPPPLLTSEHWPSADRCTPRTYCGFGPWFHGRMIVPTVAQAIGGAGVGAGVGVGVGVGCRGGGMKVTTAVTAHSTRGGWV